MRKKLLSMLVLLMVAVTGAWADTTITWGSAELSSLTDDQLSAGATKTVNGITVTVNAGTNNYLAVTPVGTVFSATNDNAFTFSTELGNFTKIECTSLYLSGTLGDGWDGATWTGDANSVNMSNAGSFLAVSSITFTIGEPEPQPAGYTVSLKDGVKDADKWTISPASAAENETVTITYAGTKSVNSVTAKRKTTTGNITVYFTDALDYGDVHVYYWPDGVDWPGTAMTYVETNGYSQKIYKAVIPATPEGVIFNGNGRQTGDITENIADGSWWYTTDNNEVGYVGKYTENIEVTNVDDNKWTFTMPDYDVELEVEYKDGATGISNAKADFAKNANWYDLSGRPLNGKPTKAGVYVKNGKKVVIK